MERWDTWNRVEAACEAIDAVFLALGNKKSTVVDELFSDLGAEQRHDWLELSPHAFWLALDQENRKRLMRISLRLYGSDETNQALLLEERRHNDPEERCRNDRIATCEPTDWDGDPSESWLARNPG
ncbi:hypothetical protein LCGC14_0734350 [marine sediment metagenome]|uniref:Uncharacterized protein n=1 Tax=marine sediment metagenome TaxID=412755 RepID=A0A0F9STR9_9ZZZZ